MSKNLSVIKRALRDESEPRPPSVSDKIWHLVHGEQLTRPVILEHVRGTEQVVHGARAMNLQIPSHLKRATEDWDIIAKEALREADAIEDKLDAIFGADVFYVKPLLLKGYYPKVVFRVINRLDGKVIIDYTTEKILPPHIVADGVKYEMLKVLREKALRILRDPRFKFRWRKARADLMRIDKAIEQAEWSNKMKELMLGLLR